MQRDIGKDLQARYRELQIRLKEAEETLCAIRQGEIDAVVAAGPHGDAVYTLNGADAVYRLMVQQMREGAMTLTKDGLILFANDQVAAMMGQPLERVIGNCIQNFVAPEGRQALDALLGSPNGAKSELHLRRSDGEILPAYLAASQLRCEGLECVILALTDLTEQKRNEEIVAAGKLAHKILEQAAAAILVLDTDGRIIQVNRAAERLARAPVLLRPFSSVFVLRSRSKGKEISLQEIFSALQQHGNIAGLQAIVQLPNGHAANVLLNAGLLTGPNAELLGSIITLSDVSKLKRTEQALRDSEQRYRVLFESMQEAFVLAEIVCGQDGNAADWRYLDVNPAYESMSGRKRAEVVGRTYREMFPETACEYWIGAFGEVALSRRAAHVPPRASHGGRQYEAIAYSPHPGQFAAVFTDVTERQKADERIRDLNAELETHVRERTAQLEAANQELEAFAYSVSHDLRAPLRGIDGWSLALLEDYTSQLDEKGKQFLHRVRAETQRMALLIDDLLQLSRVSRSEMQCHAVNLSALAQTIAARLKEANANRQIEFQIEPGLRAVADARLLEIAMTNLLNNAVKFTGVRERATIQVGQAQSSHSTFYIRDNGVGFDMAYASKLFGAFQRLHKSSQFPGTGIGLAIVQRIVRRHGGRVWAEAQPDQGATFYFALEENTNEHERNHFADRRQSQ